MKLPRKTKKVVTQAIVRRWPRRGSKAHRRFRAFCRRAIVAIDTAYAEPPA
jgi:hypothetical protein